ncbi:MAG: maleylpyruvate isomerase N-terminal domain-containing protein, partial [Actinomycetota bacterium]
MLSTQIYLDAFDADGARLLEVAAGAMDADVAACPGWDVGQLLIHVGQVYNFIGAALDVVGIDERPSPPALEVPDGDARIEWLAGLHGGLSAALRSTDPAAPAW